MKTIEERIQEYVANAWVELDQFNEDHVTFEISLHPPVLLALISNMRN